MPRPAAAGDNVPDRRSRKMAIKDILVHIDRGVRNSACLEAAVALAAAHDAHLIGLYVLWRPVLPSYIVAYFDEATLKASEQMLQDDAARAEALFNERVAAAGVKGEWRCVEGELLPTLSQHARYADFAIVSQRVPSDEQGADESSVPDQLVLSVGRPVLVIPYVGDYPLIGSRVMVAWDASRLATRAINDAIPFLQRAEKVSVIAVNPTGDDADGEIPSADICLHLSRHGVNAEAQHVYADDLGVGDMLLSRAADEGCDLMVIGAYGHARWRELVLGGVTRHMLQHMTLPVLMSH